MLDLIGLDGPQSLESAGSVTVHVARTAEERRAAFRLRYRVYVAELQILGRPLVDIDHALEDAFDRTALILIAKVEDVVVGTVRSNDRQSTDFGMFAQVHRLSELSWLHPAQISMTSRLVVDRSYRSGVVAVALARSLFGLGRSHGIALDVIDCERRLVPFYQRLGYELASDIAFEHPEFGARMPMRLWTDPTHLRQRGSLLLARRS